MQWEAIAINADFWSQVLQSKTLKPLDFALGAVMVMRRAHLKEIGGFEVLVNCLADDYQLGNRMERNGHSIALSTVVVECWDPPMDWREVWNHQMRWARTIRVCRPISYFFSILSNAGFWALLWLVWGGWLQIQQVQYEAWASGSTITMPIVPGFVAALGCLAVRIVIAIDLQRRLARTSGHSVYFWLVPIKDLLQAALWFGAFAGDRIDWRGEKFRLRRDGTLVPEAQGATRSDAETALKEQ
jgi:ceramide glucosyltransferase